MPRRFIDFKQWCKDGFQKFCDGTSLHGYAELYHANTGCWIVFWILMVAGAGSVTTYQVYQAIDQFMNQNTLTITETVDPNDVVYPPLKLCYAHWMDWVNQTKVNHLGLTREGLLFGLSYLTPIYSSSSYDPKQGEANFDETMIKHRFTVLTEFFKAIIIDPHVNDVIVDDSFYTTKSFSAPKIFTTLEFVQWERYTHLLCFVVSGESLSDYFTKMKVMKKNITRQGEQKNILQILLLKTFERFQLTTEEYNSYTAEWISKINVELVLKEDRDAGIRFADVQLDYTRIVLPKYLFVDGFSDEGLTIISDIEKYVISVKCSAHKWQNNHRTVCIDGFKIIVTNITCTKACNAKEMNLESRMDCPLAEEPTSKRLNSTFTAGFCRHDLYFIHDRLDKTETVENKNNFGTETTTSFEKMMDVPQNSKMEKQDVTENPSHQPEDTTFQLWTTGNDMGYEEYSEELLKENMDERERQECFSRCVPGCAQWTYDTSIVTKFISSEVKPVVIKYVTTIKIEYPPDHSILNHSIQSLTMDMDSQSWEGFVGSVGGILGIWTGASIVSIIQLFYLCCCTEVKLDTFLPKRQKRNAVVSKRIFTPRITRTNKMINVQERPIKKIEILKP